LRLPESYEIILSSAQITLKERVYNIISSSPSRQWKLTDVADHYQPHLVAPSAIQAPINRFMPHELTHDEILQLIDDFAHCAQLA
ncbi:hypothetical protein MJM59_30840, partial [Salmonella enterica subsp. enterica serovar Montevideo]|nr:hypothetical protein [Salmonella enterica subsp. enterica serovar Montevideo]